LWWISTGSAFLAAAALTRTVGIVLLPILAVCTAVWMFKFPGRRLAAITASILPGIAVFAVYIGACKLTHGQYLGLREMRGWHLYCRVAPFADCRKFNPPKETKVLCEEKAPKDRPGPFGYVWDSNSTPRRNFELIPKNSRKLAAFAKEAILHQPWDYVSAVLVDLTKYADPTINLRPLSGQPPEILSFGWRDPAVEQVVVQAMSRAYSGTDVYLHGQWVLAHYQNIFRVNGLLICIFAFFTVAGMFRARGSVRLSVFLFGVSAFALYLVPVLTLSYDFRYGIPPATFLAVSGVLGAFGVWSHPGRPSRDIPELFRPNDCERAFAVSNSRRQLDPRRVESHGP
jgi:hypothetical protein